MTKRIISLLFLLAALAVQTFGGTLLLSVPADTLPGMGGVEVYRLDDGTVVANGLSDSVLALEIDALGNVYEADAGGTIYKINPSGGVSIFTTSAVTGETIPVDLTLSQSGSLYMVGRSSQSLKILSNDGSSALTLATGLSNPSSMALDVISGNIYITESDTGRVVEVTPSLSTSYFLEDLNTPSGVAVDATGNVYVADSNGIVRQSGGTLTLWSPVVVSGSTLTIAGSTSTLFYGGDLGIYSMATSTSAGTLRLSGGGGGSFAVMAAPEPARTLLLVVALVSCVMRRRRPAA